MLCGTKLIIFFPIENSCLLYLFNDLILTMRQIRKISLNLTLVIIMIIQPVMFSYAMANMHHNHHGAIETAHNYDQHHSAVFEHGNHAGHEQNSESDSDVMTNCCASPACSGAIISSFSSHPPEVPFEHLSAINTSQKGVVLAADTKPPRSFSVLTA